MFIREERVLGLAGPDAVEVVRQRGLQKLTRLRTLDLELAHVGHVEDATVAADGEVLRDDALVLHRHLPAGEGNQPCAERDMPVVERRAQERLHRALMLKARDSAAPVDPAKRSRPGFGSVPRPGRPDRVIAGRP